MSRVGKNEVNVPEGVDFSINGRVLSVKGKLGELTEEITDAVKVEYNDSKVSVKPVLGIGGIDANNAESVIRAGADGVAVISSIWGSHNPKRATKSLKEKLQVNKYQ